MYKNKLGMRAGFLEKPYGGERINNTSYDFCLLVTKELGRHREML